MDLRGHERGNKDSERTYSPNMLPIQLRFSKTYHFIIHPPITLPQYQSSCINTVCAFLNHFIVSL